MVFAGDSITDCGRMQNPPYGWGYVNLLHHLIRARHPQVRVKLVNAGVSGDTVIELKNRWEDDVLSLNPDWISILIGINDLHRMLSGQAGYDPESYYRNYQEILRITKSALRDVRLILLSPFYISRATIRDTHRRRVLDTIPSYVEKVRRLSEEFSTYYVDLHATFQSLLEYGEPTVYAPEAVHPSQTGHMVIALAILSILEG